jgi:hypothetical protein
MEGVNKENCPEGFRQMKRSGEGRVRTGGGGVAVGDVAGRGVSVGGVREGGMGGEGKSVSPLGVGEKAKEGIPRGGVHVTNRF